jgi:NAD(P)-dependent dehydrogenase (short-subunit alcohol dehydrogenase family)
MKHVLITGGSDGLGKVAAKQLLAASFAVTILSHNEEKTKAAAEELGCKYVVADVAKYDQVELAIKQAEQTAPIDILINNAGIWIQDALEANDPARIKQVMEVNALGTMYCTRAVESAMKARKNGRIINVISGAGLHGKAERAAYGASKFAVRGFTECMQLELKPFNIAVDGFYPGAMDTPLFGKAGNSRDMSRALDPSVAADSLAYLCNLPGGISVPEFGILSLAY